MTPERAPLLLPPSARLVDREARERTIRLDQWELLRAHSLATIDALGDHEGTVPLQAVVETARQRLGVDELLHRHAYSAGQEAIDASDARPANADLSLGAHGHEDPSVSTDAPSLRRDVAGPVGRQQPVRAPEHGDAAVSASADRVFLHATGRRERTHLDRRVTTRMSAEHASPSSSDYRPRSAH